MWFYIKKGFFSFIYLIFMTIISLGILMIPENLNWLRVILLLVNLAMYLFITGASAIKDGKDALKVRTSNDLERMQIIRTGEDRPLKLKEEYKPYKGFIIGFCICLPLFILLAVHTILIFTVGESTRWAGATAGIIYMVTYAFFKLTSTTVTAYHFYYSLVFAVVVIPVYGAMFIVGGKKLEAQQKIIKDKQSKIYGDKN